MAILPAVGKRWGAPVAIAVPLSAPPRPTEGVAQGPPSWPTDKAEAALRVAAMPAEEELAQVAAEDTQVAVEVSPVVVAAASPAAAVAGTRAVAAVGVVVAVVADTTNLPAAA